MAAPLPPFGIRNLVNSEEAYSVLQVDEAQYDSTIQSHPSAILMYVDEDDGENVTVGSGLELKQRLEDPPPATAPLIHFYNPSNEQLELQFIHLFDIQRSNASQSVWQEQHAYFTKDQQKIELSQTQANEKDAATEAAEDRIEPNTPTQNQEAERALSQQQSEAHGKTQSDTRPVVVLSNPVPDLIENLANLLETTSETLRKVTEKTRDSNTSPIEDVLLGVSNIVTEIGNFGMGLLESMENQRADTHMPANQKANLFPTEYVPEPRISGKRSDPVESRVAANDETDVISDAHQVSGANLDGESSPRAARTGCDFCMTMKLQCRKSPNSTMACTNCVTLERSCVGMLASDNSVADRELDNNNTEEPNTVDRRTDSILDQDTEDVDFSRRYPPLMSLRRANTVAGSSRPFETLQSNVPSVERHNSCKSRYLRRPIPQVFDAETQRRRDFARQCFPLQRYTPGLGAQKDKPVSPPYWKFRRPLTIAEFCQANQPLAFESAGSVGGSKPHDTPPKDKSNVKTAPESTKSSIVQLVNAETNQETIPGAWPDPMNFVPASPHPSSESSGAFFDRMMREGSTSRQNIHGMESIGRHPSLIRNKPTNNPFNNLTRSKTVSGPPNPASRLSGPFEPLYPTFQAPHPTNASKDSNLSQSSRKSGNRESMAHQKSSNERLRPAHLYRPISPVWEDNLDHKRAKLSYRPTNHLDHRGESSSMYSPPPRHMQSVPNFATFTANLNSNKSALSLPPDPSPPALAEKTIESLSILSSEHVPVSAPPPSVPEVQTTDTFPSNPFQQSRTVSPEPLAGPVRPENPLNKALSTCLSTLRAMGYGCDDENLRDRLQMYAEAANGDVMEAVEMIEEDKKAHFGMTVQGQLRDRYDDMDWESDSSIA